MLTTECKRPAKRLIAKILSGSFDAEMRSPNLHDIEARLARVRMLDNPFGHDRSRAVRAVSHARSNALSATRPAGMPALPKVQYHLYGALQARCVAD